MGVEGSRTSWMSLWVKGIVALVALVLVGTTPAAASRQQSTGVASAALVIDDVTVIDVEQGRLVPDQRVVIMGNHIRTVGARGAVQRPQAAQVIDARGKYLIPGLWDMHVHPKRMADLLYPLLLANGVTGIRDAWSPVPLDTLRQWRQEILAGTRIGPPRQLLSGAALDESADCEADTRERLMDHSCVPSDDSAAARQLVDRLKAAGADIIKMYGLSKAMYFVIGAEARRVGLPFGGHINAEDLTAAEASDSGAGIIDHFGFGSAAELDQLCGGKTGSVAACSPLAERLRRNGTWWEANITNNWWTLPVRLASRRIVKHYHEAAAKFWGITPRPESKYRLERDSTDADSLGLLSIAQRVGLPLLAGTDSGDEETLLDMPPGFSTHLELAVRVSEGLTPLEALRSATLNPAKFFHGTDSLGTVAPGKLADLVLLDANPLMDIANTAAIHAVIANGRYFDRQALDAALASVQAQSHPALLAHCAAAFFSNQCYARVGTQPQAPSQAP